MATLETITQYLLAKFPSFILAFAAGGFIWFANSTNRRLDHLESVEVPKIQMQEIRVVRAEDKLDQLVEDMKEVKTELKEIRAEQAEMKSDIKLILSKLK